MYTNKQYTIRRDNLVMIQAGEAIDASFGVIFSLSTMTAAGFGQCFSDVAGITCGGIVDATVAKLNLPRHNLTPDQLELKQTRMFTTLGGCVGVVTGCLLGMSCLLFMDTDRADRAKRAKELQSIFESIMEQGTQLVDAQRVALFMLDNEKNELWSQVATGMREKDIIKISSNSGLVGAAVSTKQLLNIPDAYQDSRFNHSVDDKTGFKTQSVIVVPFTDDEGNVLGAIEMINKIKHNKEDGTEEVTTFDTNDEKLLKLLALHVKNFIKTVDSR